MKSYVFVALLIVFICALVAETTAAAVKIEVITNTNSTTAEVVEEVKFEDGSSKPKVIDLKFSTSTNPFQKKLTKTHRNKNRRHRFHMRRHCCQAGDLAGKQGLSCDMSRNFRSFFMNQTTRMRQKYQGNNKFHMKKTRRLYRRISKCVVNDEMKKAVQKCCLAYVAKESRWRQG